MSFFVSYIHVCPDLLWPEETLRGQDVFIFSFFLRIGDSDAFHLQRLFYAFFFFLAYLLKELFSDNFSF